MWQLILAAFCAVFIVPSLAQITCEGQPDGAYGHGCQSYTSCKNGTAEVIYCPLPGFAFDHRTGGCEPASIVPPPCGSIGIDCKDLEDARYAVMPDCMYYYTCNAGIFFGSNPCNDPPDQGALVFDYDMQLCNWKRDVLPPCGDFNP